jgi:hypothetical protein
MSHRETLNNLAAQTIAIWGHGGALVLAEEILARVNFRDAVRGLEADGVDLQPFFFEAVADELREYHCAKTT